MSPLRLKSKEVSELIEQLSNESQLTTSSAKETDFHLLQFTYTLENAFYKGIYGESPCFVCVDSWPNFQFIVFLVVHSKHEALKHAWCFLSCRPQIGAHSRQEEFNETMDLVLLTSLDVTDPRDAHVEFFSIKSGLDSSLLEEYFTHRQCQNFLNGPGRAKIEYILYHSSQLASEHVSLDDVDSPESLEDAEQITNAWSWNFGDQSTHMIHRLCNCGLPKACLRDHKTGRMIAWSISNYNGTIGKFFVLPTHRGRGLSRMILLKMTTLCRQVGRIPIIETEAELLAMRKVLETGGYSLLSDKNFFYVPDPETRRQIVLKYKDNTENFQANSSMQ